MVKAIYIPFNYYQTYKLDHLSAFLSLISSVIPIGDGKNKRLLRSSLYKKLCETIWSYTPRCPCH